MNLPRLIKSHLRGLTRKDAFDSCMDEEMRSHIELQTHENIEAGMNPEEARYAALRQFGWVETIKQDCRDQRGGRWLDNLTQDVRYGLRQLLKNPGFTVVAVLTLGLGIGVNTTMFSALRVLLARPLPYPEAGRLVQVFQTSPRSPRAPHHSVPNFLDYQAAGTFELMAAMNDKPFNLAEPGQSAERVRGLQVSADFFPLLGIQPELGRWFTRDEDQPGKNNVVLLDHGFWQRRFAGATNIVGRVIRLDGESVTVAGVMPARFHDIMLMGPTSLWRPIAFTGGQRGERGHQFLKCIARLKPGMALAQAQAAAGVLAETQRKEHPDSSAEGLRIIPLAEASLPPQARTMVWSVMALAGFVLLIACANLANLQFAQTARRGRELAVRGALGAPRGRLLRQLLAESLLLALLGGVLGLLLARWSNDLLARQFVVGGETVLRLPLNLGTFAFALAAASLSGLAFGLVPAWLAARADVGEALKQGARGSTGDRSQHRVQHGLVIAEVALAMALLAGAGLVVNGLRGFVASNPGWKVEGMSIGYLTLPESKYGGAQAVRAFCDTLGEKLAGLPGVERVAFCWNLPVRQFNVTSSFNLEGRPEPPKGAALECSVNGVTPGYFETLGMRLRAGRDFTADDAANRPRVVIINEAMASAFWPGESPLGQRIDGAEIVGVAGNVRFPANPAEAKTRFQTYRPFAQEPQVSLNVVVRGPVSAGTLRKAVTEVDPDQPVGQPGPVSADVGESLQNWAVGGRLLSVFALLGVCLSALGIYGVISGFVVRRTGEIGVRMALGARVGDVLWLVVGRGLRLSLLGTLAGLLGAVAIARLLGSVLPGLPANSPLVLAGVAVALLVVTLVACWLPARRAAAVDPMVALRQE